MIRLDLTAEVTALRDRAIQPKELGELFAMVDGMPAEFRQLFREANSYNRLYDVLNALEDIRTMELQYVK